MSDYAPSRFASPPGNAHPKSPLFARPHSCREMETRASVVTSRGSRQPLCLQGSPHGCLSPQKGQDRLPSFSPLRTQPTLLSPPFPSKGCFSSCLPSSQAFTSHRARGPSPEVHAVSADASTSSSPISPASRSASEQQPRREMCSPPGASSDSTSPTGSSSCSAEQDDVLCLRQRFHLPPLLHLSTSRKRLREEDASASACISSLGNLPLDVDTKRRRQEYDRLSTASLSSFRSPKTPRLPSCLARRDPEESHADLSESRTFLQRLEAAGQSRKGDTSRETIEADEKKVLSTHSTDTSVQRSPSESAERRSFGKRSDPNNGLPMARSPTPFTSKRTDLGHALDNALSMRAASRCGFPGPAEATVAPAASGASRTASPLPFTVPVVLAASPPTMPSACSPDLCRASTSPLSCAGASSLDAPQAVGRRSEVAACVSPAASEETVGDTREHADLSSPVAWPVACLASSPGVAKKPLDLQIDPEQPRGNDKLVEPEFPGGTAAVSESAPVAGADAPRLCDYGLSEAGVLPASGPWLRKPNPMLTPDTEWAAPSSQEDRACTQKETSAARLAPNLLYRQADAAADNVTKGHEDDSQFPLRSGSFTSSAVACPSPPDVQADSEAACTWGTPGNGDTCESTGGWRGATNVEAHTCLTGEDGSRYGLQGPLSQDSPFQPPLPSMRPAHFGGFEAWGGNSEASQGDAQGLQFPRVERFSSRRTEHGSEGGFCGQLAGELLPTSTSGQPHSQHVADLESHTGAVFASCDPAMHAHASLYGYPGAFYNSFGTASSIFDLTQPTQAFLYGGTYGNNGPDDYCVHRTNSTSCQGFTAPDNISTGTLNTANAQQEWTTPAPVSDAAVGHWETSDFGPQHLNGHASSSVPDHGGGLPFGGNGNSWGTSGNGDAWGMPGNGDTCESTGGWRGTTNVEGHTCLTGEDGSRYGLQAPLSQDSPYQPPLPPMQPVHFANFYSACFPPLPPPPVFPGIGCVSASYPDILLPQARFLSQSCPGPPSVLRCPPPAALLRGPSPLDCWSLPALPSLPRIPSDFASDPASVPLPAAVQNLPEDSPRLRLPCQGASTRDQSPLQYEGNFGGSDEVLRPQVEVAENRGTPNFLAASYSLLGAFSCEGDNRDNEYETQLWQQLNESGELGVSGLPQPYSVEEGRRQELQSPYPAPYENIPYSTPSYNSVSYTAASKDRLVGDNTAYNGAAYCPFYGGSGMYETPQRSEENSLYSADPQVHFAESEKTGSSDSFPYSFFSLGTPALYPGGSLQTGAHLEEVPGSGDAEGSAWSPSLESRRLRGRTRSPHAQSPNSNRARGAAWTFSPASLPFEVPAAAKASGRKRRAPGSLPAQTDRGHKDFLLELLASRLEPVKGVHMDRLRKTWVASWLVGKRRITRIFSFQKFGFFGAREQAIRHRREALLNPELDNSERREALANVERATDDELQQAADALPFVVGVTYHRASRCWVANHRKPMGKIVQRKKFAVAELGFLEARYHAAVMMFCWNKQGRTQEPEDYDQGATEAFNSRQVPQRPGDDRAFEFSHPTCSENEPLYTLKALDSGTCDDAMVLLAFICGSPWRKICRGQQCGDDPTLLEAASTIQTEKSLWRTRVKSAADEVREGPQRRLEGTDAGDSGAFPRGQSPEKGRPRRRRKTATLGEQEDVTEDKTEDGGEDKTEDGREDKTEDGRADEGEDEGEAGGGDEAEDEGEDEGEDPGHGWGERSRCRKSDRETAGEAERGQKREKRQQSEGRRVVAEVDLRDAKDTVVRRNRVARREGLETGFGKKNAKSGAESCLSQTPALGPSPPPFPVSFKKRRKSSSREADLRQSRPRRHRNDTEEARSICEDSPSSEVAPTPASSSFSPAASLSSDGSRLGSHNHDLTDSGRSASGSRGRSTDFSMFAGLPYLKSLESNTRFVPPSRPGESGLPNVYASYNSGLAFEANRPCPLAFDSRASTTGCPLTFPHPAEAYGSGIASWTPNANGFFESLAYTGNLEELRDLCGRTPDARDSSDHWQEAAAAASSRLPLRPPAVHSWQDAPCAKDPAPCVELARDECLAGGDRQTCRFHSASDSADAGDYKFNTAARCLRGPTFNPHSNAVATLRREQEAARGASGQTPSFFFPRLVPVAQTDWEADPGRGSGDSLSALHEAGEAVGVEGSDGALCEWNFERDAHPVILPTSNCSHGHKLLASSNAFTEAKQRNALRCTPQETVGGVNENGSPLFSTHRDAPEAVSALTEVSDRETQRGPAVLQSDNTEALLQDSTSNSASPTQRRAHGLDPESDESKTRGERSKEEDRETLRTEAPSKERKQILSPPAERNSMYGEAMSIDRQVSALPTLLSHGTAFP
ncbi:AP2 domain transcription factor AP2III-3 [Toxoplasma gondii CAST]|uniref:AP2 domain transcription factor AP2III-3 n=1 Tax=Toxoplasma gondii CAST TaxID=943122 RepID=A0A425HQZ2_TOXGO|nr:AP2 domain transcription factor AP2III-3 [Toxoplasma gondii CAST]